MNGQFLNFFFTYWLFLVYFHRPFFLYPKYCYPSYNYEIWECFKLYLPLKDIYFKWSLVFLNKVFLELHRQSLNSQGIGMYVEWLSWTPYSYVKLKHEKKPIWLWFTGEGDGLLKNWPRFHSSSGSYHLIVMSKGMTSCASLGIILYNDVVPTIQVNW